MCYSTLELLCRVTVQYMYVANECLRKMDTRQKQTVWKITFQVARIPLKSVLYFLKHLLWTFKCFGVRQFNCRKAQNHFSSPEQSVWNYGYHPSKEVWSFCCNVRCYIWRISLLEHIPLDVADLFQLCQSCTLGNAIALAIQLREQGEQLLLIFLLAVFLE